MKLFFCIFLNFLSYFLTLGSKVLGLCETGGSDKFMQFMNDKVIPQEDVLTKLIEQYEYIMKHKVFKGQPNKPVTAADIKAQIVKDSKICKEIASLVQVAHSM